MANTPFTSISDIISLQTQTTSSFAQNIYFFKDARIGNGAATASVAGNYTSLWMYNGAPSSGNNTIPGASAICNRMTTGSMYQSDPVLNRLYLLGVVAGSLSAGTLILYDRLVHMGGLSGTTITPQAVSSSALTRYSGSNSVGNQMFVEIFTPVGATAVSINATYINQDGNTAVTPSASIGGVGLQEATRIIPLRLATGDTGVRSVDRVILSATTATAGNFGVFIGHPLAVLPISTVAVGTVRDMIFGVPSIPQIEANACLTWMWLANGVTAPQIYGELRIVEK